MVAISAVHSEVVTDGTNASIGHFVCQVVLIHKLTETYAVNAAFLWVDGLA